MEVNPSEASREIELANRLLRDRERDHAREIENLRGAQAEQIADMSDKQAGVLRNVRAQTAEAISNSRDKFDDAIKETTDTFEKKINAERSEAYDRYGRLATESNHDRAKAQELKNRQMSDLIAGYETRVTDAKAEQERTMKNELKAFEAEKFNITAAANRKLEMKDDAMVKLHKEEQADAGKAIREAQISSALSAKRDADGARARYEKLLNDSQNEQGRAKRESAAREMQLQADAKLNQQRERQSQTATFENYRERATESLNSTVENANRERAAIARNNESKTSKLRQDLEAEKQSAINRGREVASDLMAQNDMLKAKTALKESLDEKRHRQDMYMTSTAINDDNAANADEAKAEYNERLHAMNETNRRNFEKFSGDAQNRATESEQAHNAFESQAELEHHAALKREATEHQRSRNNLIREYEARQRGTEDTSDKQREATLAAARADVGAVREQANQEISKANRARSAGIYEAQLDLRNRTDEQESLRKMQLGDAEMRYRNQAKRLNDNYNKNLMSAKDSFDDEWNSYKYETNMQILKSRGDAEHEKRMALLDLLQKNRAQMADMEAKFAEQKDSFDSELMRVRAESEKTIRETMKRARDTIETDRTQHVREIEAKDMATKEKLRLQEEAFRDQIEKIRRSNDLSIKKG